MNVFEAWILHRNFQEEKKDRQRVKDIRKRLMKDKKVQAFTRKLKKRKRPS